MTDARTRIRERRQDRRDARRAREHREAERMSGLALRDSDPPSLLRPFLGERRALRITAAALVLGLLVWLLV